VNLELHKQLILFKNSNLIFLREALYQKSKVLWKFEIVGDMRLTPGECRVCKRLTACSECVEKGIVC